MDQGILDYIKSQRISVFGIEMLDGSPHGATVHFAHQENPLTFIFETSSKYRKSEPLLANDTARATLVIGFVEGPTEKTFQADGIATLLTSDDQLKKVYLSKFPEKEAKAGDPDNIFFSFTPTWWRFTDWGRPEGKTVITSDGKVVVAGKSA